MRMTEHGASRSAAPHDAQQREISLSLLSLKYKQVEWTSVKTLPTYYKRYAARVRVKQIREADFKKWKYQAITLRNECSAGKITVEEYIQWMEDSFPNRKPKA